MDTKAIPLETQKDTTANYRILQNPYLQDGPKKNSYKWSYGAFKKKAENKRVTGIKKHH